MKTKRITGYFLWICLSLSQSVKAQFNLSCDSFCVTSIAMSSLPGNLDVTIYNANVNHVNYPTVKVLDGNGDTIADDLNQFYFFAHMGNSYQTYVVPTQLFQLPLNFTGTVQLYENIWDTVCFLSYPCSTLSSLDEKPEELFTVFPSLSNGIVTLASTTDVTEAQIDLINTAGQVVYSQAIIIRKHHKQSFNFSGIDKGLYVLKFTTRQSTSSRRIILQ